MKRVEVEKLRIYQAKARAVALSMLHPERTIVRDWYTDYRSGKGVPKPMVGFDDGQEKFKELDKELQEIKKQMNDKVAEIERWLMAIDEITDDETCTILRDYYRNCMTQEEIGQELGYEQPAISKKIDSFWKTYHE
jgi:hypothetical protein